MALAKSREMEEEKTMPLVMEIDEQPAGGRRGKETYREAAWALAGSGEGGNPHFLCNLRSGQALWQIL